MNFINEEKRIIVNSLITEWDIKSANTSIMRYYQLLPDEKISKLESMKKQDRVIAVGKLQRKDKRFTKELEKSFDDIIERFIDENNLDKEDDILSIKRDAVFVIGKSIHKSVFGNDIVKFVPKNEYVAYLRIKPYEFYFKKLPSSPDYQIDVKGLDDIACDKHKDGIFNFLQDLIDTCSNYQMSRRKINEFMKNFVTLYKNRELPIDYYREFNGSSAFKCRIMDQEVMFDVIGEDLMENIDTSYNYINLILPLIREIC